MRPMRRELPQQQADALQSPHDSDSDPRTDLPWWNNKNPKIEEVTVRIELEEQSKHQLYTKIFKCDWAIRKWIS
jgi:hypothetical protein